VHGIVAFRMSRIVISLLAFTRRGCLPWLVQQVFRLALARTSRQTIAHGVMIVAGIVVVVVVVVVVVMIGIRIVAFLSEYNSLSLKLKVKGMQLTIHHEQNTKATIHTLIISMEREPVMMSFEE
jgi:ABC-type phosphate transport system permease subunit